MTEGASRRPGRAAILLTWLAIGLAVYGIAAVVGVGGLDDAVSELPWSGFVGGLFTGLSLFAIPTLAAWTLGRTFGTPYFPTMARITVWIGLIGMAAIGLIAVLVDIGVLVIEVNARP